MSPNRHEVYAAIDGERHYQDNLDSTRTDGAQRTVGDYITMLSYYTTKAVKEWTENPGDFQALKEIRKIAAIAVRCMEEHGVVPR